MLKRFSTKLFFAILLFSSQSLIAQETYADEFSESNIEFSIQLDNNDDLTTSVFFTDKENQLLFIDFEALGEDVTEINILLNKETVLKDDVSTLPNNSIYEIDLTSYQSGKQYKMLLHTPFGILTKTFTIIK